MKPENDFKLHLGEYVHSVIEKSELSFADVAKKLNIAKSSLANRCYKPHYGTVYDLMSTSIVLDQNLFGVVNAALKKRDVYFNEYYTEEEVAELRKTIDRMTRQIDELKTEKQRLFNTIDALTNK